MVIYRVISYFVFAGLLFTSASAQDGEVRPRTPLKEKLVFGGNVIASFSNNQTALGLSPRVGYRVSDRYIPGIGLSYLYQNFSNTTVNNYAFSIFNRFYPIEQGFIEAEFEYGRSTFSVNNLSGEEKFVFNYPALLVGGGIRQGGGRGNVGVSFGIFYDVLQDPNSPYGQQPIFRGGVAFGL